MEDTSRITLLCLRVLSLPWLLGCSATLEHEAVRGGHCRSSWPGLTTDPPFEALICDAQVLHYLT